MNRDKRNSKGMGWAYNMKKKESKQSHNLLVNPIEVFKIISKIAFKNQFGYLKVKTD